MAKLKISSNTYRHIQCPGGFYPREFWGLSLDFLWVLWDTFGLFLFFGFSLNFFRTLWHFWETYAVLSCNPALLWSVISLLMDIVMCNSGLIVNCNLNLHFRHIPSKVLICCRYIQYSLSQVNHGSTKSKRLTYDRNQT